MNEPFYKFNHLDENIWIIQYIASKAYIMNVGLISNLICIFKPLIRSGSSIWF